MKRVYLILSVFCLVATAAQAGGGKTMSSNSSNNTSVSNTDDTKWYVNAYTGIAFSMNGNVQPADATLFNAGSASGTNVPAAEQGSDNLENATLGKSGFVGVAVNRRVWCDWLALGVAIEAYSPFRYAKQHVGGTIATASPNSEILPTNYQRSFEVSHQNVLFNVQFSLPEDWAWGCGSTNISPTFGAGVGVGLNEVRNFQAIGLNTIASSVTTNPLSTVPQYSTMVTTLGLPHSKAAVAWQANFGIKFQPEDSNVSFVAAYRFYEGGKFASSDTFMLNDGILAAQTYTSGAGVASTAVTTTHRGNRVELARWNGHIRTNQVVLCLDFAF